MNSVIKTTKSKTGRPAARFKFIKSAISVRDCPIPTLPEVGIVGRSNAGKSSLINAMANQKIAKVSSVPGKTVLLNFFESTSGYRLVDMPGYGYAARSHKDRGSWQKMIAGYLRQRQVLRGVIIVMDCRRDWGPEEDQLLGWLHHVRLPVLLAATKIDKLSRSSALRRLCVLREQTGLEAVFAVSSTAKTGINETEQHVFDHWVKGKANLPGETGES